MSGRAKLVKPVKPGTYEIDPLSAKSPNMRRLALDKLELDIREHGQRVPIVMWQGRVIDGRKRVAVCERLGIEPKAITLGDTESPNAAAYSLNILRTHYTEVQRAKYGATILTTKHGGDRKSDQGTNLSLDRKVVTVAQAADAVSVSKMAIKNASRLARTASPALQQAIDDGYLKQNAAMEIVKQHPDHDDQDKAVADIIRAKNNGTSSRKTKGKTKAGTTAPSKAKGKNTSSRLIDTVGPIDAVVKTFGTYFPDSVDMLDELVDRRAELSAKQRADIDKDVRRAARIIQRWTTIMEKGK